MTELSEHRTGTLRDFVVQQYANIVAGTTTHLDVLVASTTLAISNVRNDPNVAAVDLTATVLADLQAVYIGNGLSNFGGRGSGDFWYGNQIDINSGRRGATGFDDKFIDRSDQVQHTIGGVIRAYQYGSLVEGFVNNQDRDDAVDLAVNQVTFAIGNVLDNGNIDLLPDLLRNFLQPDADSHLSIYDFAQRPLLQQQQQIENCFLAGTMIDMWPEGVKANANGLYDEKEVLAKVWKKPIEQITADDNVLSYDKDGNLKPGKVTRTFQNKAKHILDFHGLMMTPGHATFCAEGKFKDQHVPIIDILRSDGCIQKSDGTIIRAATNCPINSAGDRFIWAVTGETKDGVTKVADKGKIRLGTRYITPDGNDVSVLDMIMSNDVVITEEGLIKHNANDPSGMPFRWAFSDKLPKPEDYILQRSQVTTQDIYQHGEWEMVFPPQMPAPFTGEVGGSYKPNSTLQASAPPNIPLSMENSPNQPTMTRKQRRAMDAKKRKLGKVKKQGSVTVH